MSAACPWCACEAFSYRRSPCQIRCENCGAEGPEAATPEEARAAWDGRAFTTGAQSIPAELYRQLVADAAGLLLTNALAGNSHFLLLVVPDEEDPEGALKFSTSVREPGDVAGILQEALQAARRELT